MVKKSRKKVRKSSPQRRQESDLGDFAKKIMQGVSSTHKVGGAGLVLMAIGAVGFLFLFLLGTGMENRNFFSLLGVSILFTFSGGLILLKEKGRNSKQQLYQGY